MIRTEGHSFNWRSECLSCGSKAMSDDVSPEAAANRIIHAEGCKNDPQTVQSTAAYEKAARAADKAWERRIG